MVKGLLFNSYEFIVLFVPVTLMIFFLLVKIRGKQSAVCWLILASLFFYGYWDYHYVPLLVFSIIFNYCIGKLLEYHDKCKYILIFGIFVDIGLFGYFKYSDFIISTVNFLGNQHFELTNVVLPLGISFFTFTQIAYLVDVYRGEVKDFSILYYFEFVTIFPHLIAGPVINYKDMISQFMSEGTFRLSSKNIALGLAVFSIGLAKKVMVADTLSVWVNEIFGNIEVLTFLRAWIGAISYSLQLYFDFSGYSEMAIGLGLMINLQFPMNFNSPYQARSIIDFWRRWHMTLSDWVKNYLYIPMGGNRNGEFCKMRNLFLSMLIIGLWHGAGWTFVLWGGIHGVLLIVNHQWRHFNIKLPGCINWIITFMSVVICWVFFRAESFDVAMKIIVSMTDIYAIGLPDKGFIWNNFGFLSEYGVHFSSWTLPAPLHEISIVLSILMLSVVFLPNPLLVIENNFLMKHKILPMLLGILLGVSLLMMNVGNSEFLYFQF